MKRYSKKFLLLLILCSIFSEFIFTTALCKDKDQEKIPISSSLGISLSQLAINGTTELNYDEMKEAFTNIDIRGNENKPTYVLLRMSMDKINKKTNKPLKFNEEYKGSGTVLYRLNDHILVLTAYHNLYEDDAFNPDYALKTSQMRLMRDNKKQNNPDDALAEIVVDNYIQIAQKDIALVAMSLYEKDVFENDKITFDILDFKNFQQPGQGNRINAEINQYPTYFDWYIKTTGSAYHENGKGYHYIPTLPGASGSAVIINGKIAGVHVSSGNNLLPPNNKINIKYNNRNILVENNIFELISLGEIKQDIAKFNNGKDKVILANLVQKYIAKLQREKLIEYLESGRKIQKDKDTDPAFLEEINKLNEERMFWPSWVFWPKKIEEITDEIVEAYNYNNAKTEL